MSEEAQSEKVRFEILGLAKQFLSGRLGVVETARALAPLGHDVDSEVADILLTFTGIDSETDHLPVGRIRDQWREDALALKDREIEKADAFYHDMAIEAAVKLVRLLEKTH